MADDAPWIDEATGTAGRDSAADGPSVQPFVTEQTDPLVYHQEATRGVLGRALLLILATIVAAVIAFVGTGVLQQRYLAETVFPAIVTLVATALGFYFGSQANSRGN